MCDGQSELRDVAVLKLRISLQQDLLVVGYRKWMDAALSIGALLCRSGGEQTVGPVPLFP